MTDTMQRYIDRINVQDESIKRLMKMYEEVREQHLVTIRQLAITRELVDDLSKRLRYYGEHG